MNALEQFYSELDQTWMGEDASRRSNARDVDFSYIKLIKPGINSYFDELQKWKAEPNYYPNFSSLMVKIYVQN